MLDDKCQLGLCPSYFYGNVRDLQKDADVFLRGHEQFFSHPSITYCNPCCLPDARKQSNTHCITWLNRISVTMSLFIKLVRPGNNK